MNEIQKNKINRKLNNDYEIEIKALTEKISCLEFEIKKLRNTAKENKMKIENKQDVIKWLKRLKRQHPLTSSKCISVASVDDIEPSFEIEVFTDQVIRNRYQGMIDYLESDEVK